MRIAWLDASSGISGDMFLAALLSAGASLNTLEAIVESLQLTIKVGAETVERSGARTLRLLTSSAHSGSAHSGAVHAPHLHDHPHAHHHHHPRPATGEIGHPHVPAASAANANGSHTHGRSLTEILRLLDSSELNPAVRRRAVAAFRALGEAEAHVHGNALETIHFHEVGQDDAILDIVGTAALIEELRIERIVCSPLNTGSGVVECAHGRFSVPAPATVELLKGLPAFSSGIKAELVTPTGAALVRAFAETFGPLPAMTIAAVGYGAGSYDLPDHPDVLRIFVGESAPETVGPDANASVRGARVPRSGHSRTAAAAGRASLEKPARGGGNHPSADHPPEEIDVIEANLDDMNPQVFGYVFERLFAAGALDAYIVPVLMKKERPGSLLTVLAAPGEAEALAEIVLRETTTLGVRTHRAHRTVLDRHYATVSTSAGDIRVKIAGRGHEIFNVAPEYEDCRAAAARSGIALKTIEQEAIAAFWAQRRART
jgi:uncharacterized protein (TIGR00299 family) protein